MNPSHKAGAWSGEPVWHLAGELAMADELLTENSTLRHFAPQPI
jgi:hypothetical protein